MQGGKNGQGPNLWGIIGRQSGQVDGFAYSAANKNSGIMWSEKHLEVYLQDPKKVSLLRRARRAARCCRRAGTVGTHGGKGCKDGLHLSAGGGQRCAGVAEAGKCR